MTAPLSKLWFTRCPVPTAKGLAHKLGWLAVEFARDGISIATLQDRDITDSGSTAEERRAFSRHHYDHDLPGLFREGGNMLAIAARAQDAPSRLIGLTWIEEGQSLIVRADSGINRARAPEGPPHRVARAGGLPGAGPPPAAAASGAA